MSFKVFFNFNILFVNLYNFKHERAEIKSHLDGFYRKDNTKSFLEVCEIQSLSMEIHIAFTFNSSMHLPSTKNCVYSR